MAICSPGTGICIPYQAFIPFFYYIWFPLWKWLKKTFPGLDRNKKGGGATKKVEDEGPVTSQPSGSGTAAPSGKRAAAGKVVVMEDDEEWPGLAARAAAEGVPLVVDFTASWCGPCQRIAPRFKELAALYPNAVYVKCDVDECSETANTVGMVKCMPTFKVIKAGKDLAKIEGADPAALEAAIKKHCSA